jgi:hypothetical protein
MFTVIEIPSPWTEKDLKCAEYKKLWGLWFVPNWERSKEKLVPMKKLCFWMITLIGFDVANYRGVENCSYKRKSQRKLYRHSVWRHKFVKSCVVKTTPSAVRKDVWALVLMKWKKESSGWCPVGFFTATSLPSIDLERSETQELGKGEAMGDAPLALRGALPWKPYRHHKIT